MTRTLRIAIFVCDGTEELDLTGPLEVFGAWAQLWPEDGVEVTTVSMRRAHVRCANGLIVLPCNTWQTLEPVDVVVIPGGGADLLDDGLADELRQRAAQGVLVSSVCTGAFALALAGLLDGLAATTHRAFVDDLAELAPSTEIRPEARFVDCGSVITAAGVSAGIDMALHVIARYHSIEKAEVVADHIGWNAPARGARPKLVAIDEPRRASASSPSFD